MNLENKETISSEENEEQITRILKEYKTLPVSLVKIRLQFLKEFIDLNLKLINEYLDNLK